MTRTRLNAPEPVIGPRAVVPRPTETILTNSSLILRRSPLPMDEIPVRLINV